MDKKPTRDPLMLAGTIPISGRATMNQTAGTSEIQGAHEFPKGSFLDSPVVVATVKAAHPYDDLAVKLTNVTATQFNYVIFRCGNTGEWTADIELHWIATDKR